MPELWPFIPSAVSERLAFGSDVRFSPSGEARDSLHGAMQSFGLSHLFVDDTQAARAEMLYRSNALQTWYVPIWPDLTRVQSDIAAVDTTISVNTDADYTAKALIIKDADEYAIVDVASATGGTLTLSGAVGQAFTAPVLVVPLCECYAPAGLSGSKFARHQRLSISFDRIDGVDLAASAMPTHLGYEVLTDPSVVVEALSESVVHSNQVISSGFGVFVPVALKDYIAKRSTVSFSDSEAGDRWARRQWLHQMRGRETAFWLPSWKRDLVLTGSVGAADTTISVEGFAPSAADLVGRSIQIETSGGYIHRQITAGSDLAGAHVLTIAAPGVALAADTEINLMNLVRFDTDEFEISHLMTSDGFLSRFTAPVVEIPA